MLGDISRAESIYLACGHTDMRKSIDGLAALVQQNFLLDPFSNSLFLFCGRKANRLKALYWEGDGFVLLYKRLKSGRGAPDFRSGVSLVTGRISDRSAKNSPENHTQNLIVKCCKYLYLLAFSALLWYNQSSENTKEPLNHELR